MSSRRRHNSCTWNSSRRLSMISNLTQLQLVLVSLLLPLPLVPLPTRTLLTTRASALQTPTANPEEEVDAGGLSQPPKRNKHHEVEARTKRVFLYWHQGWERAPPLAQKCRRSWELHNPTWEIVLLSGANLPRWARLEDVTVLQQHAEQETEHAQGGGVDESGTRRDAALLQENSSSSSHVPLAPAAQSSLVTDAVYWDTEHTTDDSRSSASPSEPKKISHPYRPYNGKRDPHFFLPVADENAEGLSYLSTFILADALRLELLATPSGEPPIRGPGAEGEGGKKRTEDALNVWADATMLCLRPLDEWVFEKMNGNGAGMWLYHGAERVVFPAAGHGEPFQTPQPAIWFLVANSNSPMLRLWRDAYRKRWARRREQAQVLRLDAASNQVFWTTKVGLEGEGHENLFWQSRNLDLRPNRDGEKKNVETTTDAGRPATTAGMNAPDTYFLFEEHSNEADVPRPRERGEQEKLALQRSLYDDVFLPLDGKEVITNSFNIFSLDQSFLDLLAFSRRFLRYWVDDVLPRTTGIDGGPNLLMQPGKFYIWERGNESELAALLTAENPAGPFALKMTLKNRTSEGDGGAPLEQTNAGMAVRIALRGEGDSIERPETSRIEL